MIDVLFGIIDRLLRLKSIQDAKAEQAFDEVFVPTFSDLEAIHGNYLDLYEEVERQLPSFSFLERPGSHWLREYNYVNFESREDGLAFLAAEGRAGESLHVTLCPKGFVIDYPLLERQTTIPVIFRDEWSATEAARTVGDPEVRPMPEPDIPADVYPAMIGLIDHVRRTRLEYEPVRVRLRALVKELKDVHLGPDADAFIRSVINYFPDGSWEPYQRVLSDVDDLGKSKGFSSGATSVLETLRKIEAPDASTNAKLLNETSSDVHALIYSLKVHQQEHWQEVSAAFAKLQAKRLRLW